MTRLSLFITGTALLLGACATTDEDTPSTKEAFLEELMEDPRVGEEVDRICFTGSIDGFSHATDRSVVVSVSPSRDYVITTFTRCRDLDYAQSIIFDDFGACLTRGDKIYAFDSAFGPSRLDSPSLGCQVDKIYEWHKDAEAEEEPAEDEGTEEDGQDT